MVPRTDEVVRFYQAALLGLLVLDARGARKRLSGAEASARWEAFAGDMDDWDRIDLCLRDAAVQFPDAFAPRVVFSLEGLTDDEPFGEKWPRPAGPLAHRFFHDPPPTPATLADLLHRAASIWGLPLVAPAPDSIASLTMASKVRVAGAGALVAVALRLSEIEASNLIEQVTLISGDPAERQLFGLAAVFSKASGSGRILAPEEATRAGLAADVQAGA
jgi:hypothetical protein